MLIHSHFIIAGAQQDTCHIAAYFYFAASGKVLKDFDQDYKTADGQVAVGENFTPTKDSTEFKDFTLFMPYEELYLARGEHDLKFFVKIYHRPSETFVAESQYVNFSINQLYGALQLPRTRRLILTTSSCGSGLQEGEG